MATTRVPVCRIAATSLAALILGLVFGGGVAHAQNAAAETLFSEGEKLFKEGRMAEACEAFAASNRLEARAGTLLNLGTCREKLGQLASAWSAFKDAEVRAKDPKKKKTATERIRAIEPRLSFLTISVPDESRIDGLVVSRDGVEVDAALWNRAVPVDGGRYVVAGRAPGHEEWSTTVEVDNEVDKVSIEVPRFKELIKLAPPPPTPDTPPSGPEPPTIDEPEPGAPAGMFTPRRKLALGVGAVALVALAGGAVFGSQANGFESDADALCPDESVPCPDGDRANDLIDRGKSRALMANVAFGVGTGAAIGAAVLWFTGRPPADAGVAITPYLGETTGVDVQVRF